MTTTTNFPAPVDQAEQDASTWRGLPHSESHTCTACGRCWRYGEGARTVDGAEQLCGDCNRLRIDAHWHDQPAGVYRANMIDGATGEVLATGYGRHEPFTIDATAAQVWGVIMSATGGALTSTHARRLRTAWVNAAQRNVYGLPALAHDGRSHDAAVADALAADDRDQETRARAYLAAYAAIIHGDTRATPVDRLALLHAAPDDAAQVNAGERPPVGALVMLADSGEWLEVCKRSEGEQRRYPYDVRVRRQGHGASASTALANVAAISLEHLGPVNVPALAYADVYAPTVARAWQPVELRPVDADAVDYPNEWQVFAVGGRWPAYVGEVWHDSRGNWAASARGGQTANGHPSRGDVLAAVGWLDTAPASLLVDVAGTGGCVLADGTVINVRRAQHNGSDDTVTADAYVTGRVDLRQPRPVDGTGHGTASRDGAWYRLTIPAAQRVALAPPCDECDAPAGVACSPFCTAPLS